MHGENSSDVDRHLSVLCDRRRRDVLYALQEADEETMSLDELAGALVPEGSTAAAEPATDQLAELRVTLYHVHLPMLKDHGIIDFDPRSKTVRYWGNSPAEAVLESVDEPMRREKLSARLEATE
jgi:hypothetical protein